MDLIDLDYVIVSSPPIDICSSSVGISKPIHVPYKSGSPPQGSHVTVFPSSAPVPIMHATYNSGGLGTHGCTPMSYESMDNVDTLEKPSSHRVTRIKSLQQSAYAIKELVNGKVHLNNSPSCPHTPYVFYTEKFWLIEGKISLLMMLFWLMRQKKKKVAKLEL